MSFPEQEDQAKPLGNNPNRQWYVNTTTVDMSRAGRAPRRLALEAQPQNVIIDLNRTALLVIDMQNDFCSAGGWVDHIGGEFEPDRKPIEPLQALVPPLRKAGAKIIWVNWGNRPDLANMPPNQHHLYKPTGTGVGLGEPLPDNGERVLQKDSWAADIVQELNPASTDIKVDKYRISGFWDTPLESILRNHDIQTVMFAGVNLDQCVFCTLTDANFLGFGCVLLEDCCATTSPDFCAEATIWNTKKCYGFVTDSTRVLSKLSASAEA